MARKQLTKRDILNNATSVETRDLIALKEQIDNNPVYSLAVDPDGSLGLTNAEKEFTSWYIQHRNIPVAAQLAGITPEQGIAIYRKMSVQSELRRISNAIQIRQINQEALNIDQIGSILSSYILDKTVEVDRLSPKEKMEAMRLLIDINELKEKVIDDPKTVEVIEVQEQIKDLSVESIKALLAQGKQMDVENSEKEKLISEIDKDSTLSNDDLRYLRSLSVESLKDLLNQQTAILKNKSL